MNEESHRRKKSTLLRQKLHRLFEKEPESRDELAAIIKKTEHNQIIDKETFDMMNGVLKIVDLRVRDIMIPRNQMIPVPFHANLSECIDIILTSGHSRYPVISEDRDHIEGILMAKDLLIFMKNKQNDFDLKTVLRPAVIIPEAKRVDLMLKDFRSERYHMAIAIDEFGGVSGLLTIEDILELIVGEIDDEYDTIEDNDIYPLSERQYSVSALTDIEEFNEHFQTQFSDDDVDTVGGLVMLQLGRLPKKGESTVINGFEFLVAQADRSRIIQLHVTLPSNSTEH